MRLPSLPGTRRYAAGLRPSHFAPGEMVEPYGFESSAQLAYAAAAARSVQVPAFGVPDGIRTRVTAVKGRCPGPLDDGDAAGCSCGRRRTQTAAPPERRARKLTRAGHAGQSFPGWRPTDPYVSDAIQEKAAEPDRLKNHLLHCFFYYFLPYSVCGSRQDILPRRP